MREPKVILFYRFTPLEDPAAIRLWQHTLCDALSLRGRILISRHGINVTLGGAMSDLKRYVRSTATYPGFHGLDVKWSEGTGRDFARLRVRVRDEVVSFGAPDELEVDRDGVVGGGVRLSARQVHELLEQRGDDVVFFDGRNAFEAAIGRFRGAIVPDTDTTRDFVRLLDSGAYDHLKSRPVVTYCTGGVRCEVLSALMNARGFEEVYQIDGGVLRYAQEFANDGLWEGSLFVFDERLAMRFGDDATVLGHCERCATPTSRYRNCAEAACRALILLCEDCAVRHSSRDCGPRHATAPRARWRSLSPS
ncbi:MAG: rhodanese-related sulfurtransferase [Acidobacteria bacterium]|nr:rhodanese-related sulfurtransferase [Acidobacteriota bacterium]